MAITNHERVGKALEPLRGGLAPFVAREIEAAIEAKSLTVDEVRGFVLIALRGSSLRCPLRRLRKSSG